MKSFYQAKLWAMHRLTDPEMVLKLKDLKVAPCILVAREHARGVDEGRAYAHCGHLGHTVCIAPCIADLDLDHQVGIFLHEFGHILTPRGGDEKDADVAVKAWLGVTIEYDRKLELQYVAAAVTKMIMNYKEKEAGK